MKIRTGSRVRITNPAYGISAKRVGVLHVERVGGVDCHIIRFPNGEALGVGDNEFRAARKRAVK